MARKVLLWFALHGHLAYVPPDKVGGAFQRATGQDSKLLPACVAGIDGAAEGTEEKLLCAIAAYTLTDERLNISDVKTVIKAMGFDLAQHWRYDQAYLSLLTKSEIESLCEETGLVEQVGKDSFKKLLADKKEVLVDAVLKEGAFLEGKLPKVVQL